VAAGGCARLVDDGGYPGWTERRLGAGVLVRSRRARRACAAKCRMVGVVFQAGAALHLTFGDPQILVMIGYALVAPALAGVFVVIAVQSRASVPFDQVQDRGYWLRRHWLAVLVAVGVWGVGLTFFGGMPYASGAAPGVVARVSGGQFYWSITPDRFRLGSRVRFDVTSFDVNHGFGVYDPHGHLIGSVQAMPGYHNELDLTLSTAGTYHVLCFEFCGIGHAGMQGTFVVGK
jgi:cytochrome c oxidase subunit II